MCQYISSLPPSVIRLNLSGGILKITLFKTTHHRHISQRGRALFHRGVVPVALLTK